MEQWFRERLRETGQYQSIDGWWNRTKGENPSELDIVVLGTDGKKILVAEVKQQRWHFDETIFNTKVNLFKDAVVPNAEIVKQFFALEDM